MTSLGQWFFEREKAKLEEQIQGQASYTATVNTVNRNADTCTILDPFSGSAESQSLTILGFRPEPGEQVMVLRLVDGERVVVSLQQVPWVHGHVYQASNRVLSLRQFYALPATSAYTVTVNRVYYLPVLASEPGILLAGVTYNNLVATGYSVIVGLYDNDETLFLPNNRLALSGGVGNGSTIGVKAANYTGADIPLVRGRWYWLSIMFNFAGSIAGYTGVQLPMLRGGFVDTLTSGGVMAFEDAASFAMPAVASPSTLTNTYLEIAGTI